MLLSLHIENYALIQSSDITLYGGFTAITGETGAGKSIVLGALGMLLGDRADSHALYNPEQKCVVEATFDIRAIGLQQFFADNDLDYDDMLILRRELLPSVKSRAFVNDSPVQLTLLRQLATKLVDIHSQHQTLTLTSNQFQIDLLDTLVVDDAQRANPAWAVRAQYGEAFRQYHALKHRLEELTAQEAQNRKDYDYNSFLLSQLQQAALRDGEQEELEEELQALTNIIDIKEAIAVLCAVAEDNEETSALSALDMAKSRLGKVVQYSKEIAELQNRLEGALIELRDIVEETHRLDDRFQASPQRQAEVEQRLDTIYQLEKKHNVNNIRELLGIQQQLNNHLQSIATMDEEIHRTMEAVDQSYHSVQQLAARLTQQRRNAAIALEQTLPHILTQLGMKEAQIKVSLTAASDYNANGHDQVQLLFNANRGGGLREIGKVASGGELSRLMLAIKSVISQQQLLPTIIFDEIDSGVGGDIAGRVGTIMQHMARRMQVIAITHQPQIAAKASHQLKVSKSVDGDSQRTVSRIRELSESERLDEIAIMLSSYPPTHAALQTAKELMNDIKE